jgi:dimethylhistidine N-methyltransferase
VPVQCGMPSARIAETERKRMVTTKPGMTLVRVAPSRMAPSFLDAVVDGLARTRKRLPCRFFYDAEGSRLFEQICRTPEYYLTRTERQILKRSASSIVEAAGRDITLVELGSGSSSKTRVLIRALLDRQERLLYVPVDISCGILQDSSLSLLDSFPDLAVTAIAAEYSDAMPVLDGLPGTRLILFLGSNIGNFDPPEAVAFLAALRSTLRPSDRVLIGVDLVKDPRVLEDAYDDAAGVTAAFNKNLLARINAEMGGRFVISRFDHRAPFVQGASRVEMHLVSRISQRVQVCAADREFSFDAGETIHTESCHKFTVAGLDTLCRAAGLQADAVWSDERDWYAVLLLRPDFEDKGEGRHEVHASGHHTRRDAERAGL